MKGRKKIEIEVEFAIDEIVYLKTDPDQKPWMVVQYRVSKEEVLYEIKHCRSMEVVFASELSRDHNILYQLGVNKASN